MTARTSNPEQNVNSNLNKGAASEICGDIAESAVGGFTTAVGEIGRVTGRGIGEGVGGIIDGATDGVDALVERFAGPKDPEKYAEWLNSRLDRKQQKVAAKAAVATAKSLAPLENAMAQFEAMERLSSRFGARRSGAEPTSGYSEAQVQAIVDRAVQNALASAAKAPAKKTAPKKSD